MTDAPQELLWRDVPPALRALGRWITIVQLVGYTLSLAFVLHTTRMVPSGIATHYRGADSGQATDAAMEFPKSYGEMLTVTHTHLLGMAVIFVLSGLGVALCSGLSPRVKRFLVVEPFAALLISFASMWLMRYVDGRFSILLELSSLGMAATFYLQSWLILADLRRVDRGP